ncbi:ComEC/Rec2 family competence protein [Brevibacillus sp. BC25]|uniref:ComEC/Rec2 family competence protein n=1 Tax=Brevibacillus sp. BC25 TaxID=1144308 RepID=UPI00027137B8|nr:hypothetical protein [Brevibacillus sp. BC25]EJL30011.1 hypothetical protein PMI05_01627 [Brevibacillus sp. BC25]
MIPSFYFIVPWHSATAFQRQLIEASIHAVLRLQYGQNSFLFTSDAEAKSEADMLKTKQPVKADVLKVGHHGSDTSTSPSFLKAVSPKYAIISAGKDNKYGHPNPSTMKKLQDSKIATYRTDLNGTVTVTCDGKTIKIATARK